MTPATLVCDYAADCAAETNVAENSSSGFPAGGVFHAPPFLAIEILSRVDGINRMQEKFDDYFASGVEFVWVIDPQRRTA